MLLPSLLTVDVLMPLWDDQIPAAIPAVTVHIVLLPGVKCFVQECIVAAWEGAATKFGLESLNRIVGAV